MSGPNLRFALIALAALALSGCDRRRDDLQLVKDCPHTSIWVDRSGQVWSGLIPFADYVVPVSAKANMEEICR